MDIARSHRQTRRLWVLAVALCCGALPMPAARAQATARADPVTGPGVTTIGNIGTNARINLRSGPAVIFPAVGTLGYGSRVNKGLCIGGGSNRGRPAGAAFAQRAVMR